MGSGLCSFLVSTLESGDFLFVARDIKAYSKKASSFHVSVLLCVDGDFCDFERSDLARPGCSCAPLWQTRTDSFCQSLERAHLIIAVLFLDRLKTSAPEQ